jgi:uncharacterized protein (TIGR02453 family)
MSRETDFAGFPAAGLDLLRDLAANNNRVWFAAHRADYEALLLAPARAFVVELGARLQAIDPAIRVDPRTDGGGVLMRHHRDTRFSPDKSPYKTNVSGLFWDGRGKKTERPAFGFQLSADGLDLMTGLFAFPPPLLDAYRVAVASGGRGSDLAATLASIHGAGAYEIAGERAKRVPAGYAPEHPRADLLRRKGLYATSPRLPARQATAPALIDVVLAHFRAMAPLYRWLTEL